VVDTDPPAGTPAKRGDEVTLFVSTGNTTVPECEGLSQDDCVAALVTQGLVQGKVTTETSDKAPGTVIRMSKASGDSVKQGTKIDLVVAEARKTVKMPDLSGMNESAAQTTLDALGLGVVFMNEPSSNGVAAGIVTRSEPKAGATLTAGDKVTVWISTGPPASQQPVAPTP
jgi:serine/threonine-protein kinase